MASITDMLKGLSPYTADSYPSEDSFTYRVINGLGFNPASTGDSLAARMQTLDEHNAALNKYIVPGMNPIQLRWAIQKGLEDEQKLPSFWKDTQPRRNISAGSKAVSSVRINPDNTISIQFGGKGKWYNYRGGPNRYEASLAAQQLVTSPSIDGAIAKDGNWAITHKLF